MRRPGAALAFGVVALHCTLALGADVTVSGARARLKAGQGHGGRRSAAFLLRDPAIAAPLPDPRSATTTLVVHGGAATGQCYAAAQLDPAAWKPVRGGGYRFRATGKGTQGIRRVVLAPGRIVIAAGGPAWPCGLGAAQRVPLSVTLDVAGTRYCAAFGGERTNRRGRFTAGEAPAPAACPKDDFTVADLNILHGLFCPAPTDHCRLPERIDLLFQWIAASGCPDVVTLEEVSDAVAALVPPHLTNVCPFPYTAVYMRSNGIDDEMILSRHPVVASEVVKLHGGFRTVLFARLDHPLAPFDVFATHLASSSDGAQNPCGQSCPSECVSAGATKVRECQGVQYAAYVESRHDVAGPAVATGDFNESPGTLVYQQLASRGWVDTYLAAGNPECDPATGIGCTSGRADEELTQLESPASNEIERIDYVFLVPAAGLSCALDPAADADGDASATRIFDDLPNPFAPACGPSPEPICWPSDHEGAEMDLNCG